MTSEPAPFPGGAGTDEPNEASVVRAFLASLELLDVQRALSHVADDIAYSNVSLPTIHGRRALERALTGFARVATSFEAVNHRIAADGPVVLTERTDVLQAGRLRVSFWVCGTFEVHDGRITLWRDYFDWANVTGGLLRGLVGVAIPAVRAGAPSPR
ncbi:limonene-1,2-epoxide hydrolase family protein [Patulibacter sp.]|uniref:limonene-1,2-epoxide hydrolase family protein n=1 Tax=Patulibacter sp. TaxID=1912859 RepID=UPI0027256B18|nr:limonene-1,2-epoxide hydrolase family protein [Patulibacter sp.]MDO9410727.1 limonene-1,2-epoxide hydrolase family protein [Patulibacter sp.]